MIIVMRRFWRLDVQNNRWLTYVFGDNDQRAGSGGQARACRGEPNTIGIRTKKEPNLLKCSFYTDAEYKDNIAKIDQDLDAVEELLKQGNIVVFPKDGFGTGYAQLRMHAPKTYLHLNNRVRELLLKYRVPEITDDVEVRAFKPHLQTLVSLRISTKTFERSLSVAGKYLRMLGVEDPHESVVRGLIRDIFCACIGVKLSDISVSKYKGED